MNTAEIEKLQGLPWQPDPNAAGMEVQSRSVLLMEMPVTEEVEVDTKPVVARGIAVQKSEYMAMGPTSGCYGCKSLVRGDATHKLHSPECRARRIEWLKRQEDQNVQARLAAAQMRQEASRREEKKQEEQEDAKDKKRRKDEEPRGGETSGKPVTQGTQETVKHASCSGPARARGGSRSREVARRLGQ